MAMDRDQLSTYVTLILTTSQTQSNPDITVISKVISGLLLIEGLSACRWVIMCDGFYPRGKLEKKACKNSTISSDTSSEEKSEVSFEETRKSNYEAYKRNLRAYLATLNQNIDMIELEENRKFSGVMKYVIFNVVKTPLVMVVQHDWFFVRPVNLDFVVFNLLGQGTQIDSDAESLNYVVFSSPSSKTYVQNIAESEMYRGTPVTDTPVIDITEPRFNESINSCLIYPADLKYSRQNETRGDKKLPCQLFPLSYFYDRNHVAKVSFYRDYVFRAEWNNQFIEAWFGEKVRKLSYKIGFNNTFYKFKMAFYHDADFIPPTHQYKIESPLLWHLNGKIFKTEDQVAKMRERDALSGKKTKKQKQKVAKTLVPSDVLPEPSTDLV